MTGSVLRRAYVEVAPDIKGFDGSLKTQLARQDPGGKAGKQVGGQLNRALKKFDLTPIDIKADPKSALAGIAVAEARLRELSGQAATVEVKIQTEKSLGQLARFRKQIGDVGEEAAPEFAASFSGKLGPLLAKMPISAPVLAAVGGVGVAVAPVLGAAIAGAITAGAALGAVGIGVAIASQDQRVQTAAKQMGDHIKSQLQDAATPFVKSTIGALHLIESRISGMGSSIESIMRNASTFLEPLADGLGDFMEPVIRGIDALVAKASPVIEAIRGGLGEVGRAIGDVFKSLSDNGVEAGMAIGIVFDGIASTVRIVGGVINALTETFGYLIKVADKFGFLTDEGKEKLAGLRGATDQMTGASKAGAAGMGGFKAAIAAVSTSSQAAGTTLTGMAAAVAVADARIKELSESSDALFGTQMSLDRANLAVKAGMATLAAELGKGTRTLSLNSVEGRKNRGAVLDQLSAIESLRQTRIKHGTSLDEAGRKYVKDVEGLRKSMLQAGFTKGEVDDLIGAYKKIPDTVKTAVSSTGVQAVGKQLIALQAYQTALKQGTPVVSIRKQLSSDNADFLRFDVGGRTPNVGIHEPAGIVHGKEFVFDAKTVRNIDRQSPGFLEEVHATHGLPGYVGGGRVWPFPVDASKTRIPSRAEVASKVAPSFGSYPSSPAAQRGDSGVWKQVLQLIKSGPKMGSFGNAYRPGDPKWHGSGRAVDWMGFNMDPLASYLAGKRPLELIHRTNKRDYAYTRGVNKGSFSSGLMQAHRNHIHIAMDDGGFRMLQPGMNLIPNGTGKAEPIAGPRAMAAMAGGRPPVYAPITINGANHSVEQIAQAVERRLGRAVDLYARTS